MGWGTGNIGSGPGGLNFKIVGGTSEPSNTRENTIWVNTDQKITSWIFSAEEPKAPSEGMVWVTIGTSSAVKFNALKKNGLQVYPISAKQYVDGVFVYVTAKSYQDGAWVDWWNGELYTPGDEYENITGGWIASAIMFGTGGSAVAPTVTKTSTYMSVYPKKSGAHSGILRTLNSIDLSEYSTLYFEVSGTGSYTDIEIGAFSSISGSVKHFAAYKTLGGMDGNITISRNVYEIDVSGLSGNYYIGVGMYNGSSSNPVTLTIYNVYLK